MHPIMIHPQAGAKDKRKTPLVASLEEEDDGDGKVSSRDLMDENWTCIVFRAYSMLGQLKNAED